MAGKSDGPLSHERLWLCEQALIVAITELAIVKIVSEQGLALSTEVLSD